MKLLSMILFVCFAANNIAAADLDPLDDEHYRPTVSSPGAHSVRMRNPLFAAYVHRLRYRRMNALALRRQYNMSKGPHVYQLSRPSFLANPFWSAIERGRVWQPPIQRVIRIAPSLYVDPVYSPGEYLSDPFLLD